LKNIEMHQRQDALSRVLGGPEILVNLSYLA
jgi:hypothetical protein